MLGISPSSEQKERLLYDHRPLELNSDDYQRACRIPKRKVLVMDMLFSYRCISSLKVAHKTFVFTFILVDKQGACFRDLPGVRVRPDNKVEWDPSIERVYLDSGKPLVKLLFH